MGGSCCGGGCCGKPDKSDADKQSSSVGAAFLKVGLVAVVLSIAAFSTIALTSQPASTAPPAAPKAPAPPPAPVAPAAPSDAKPDIVMQGVIRHGIPQPIAKPAGVVRVATYNVENMFVPLPGGKPGDAARATEPKPEDHIKAVAEAIKRIDADVIALEEIESLEVVTNFRDKYLADSGYKYIASIDAGDDRGIEQSVLSRFPITGSKNWVHLPLGGTHPQNRNETDRTAGGPINFHRSPLCVTVEVPPAKDAVPDAKPYKLTLFAVHFKSGAKDGYWREKEAAKTAELAREVEAADPAANIIILGDFNARPQEKPTRAITQNGFVDAFGDLPDGDPKYITHASDRAIDHIMLNANAAAELDKETRFVLGTIQRPSNADWRTTPPPPGYGSDHYPVVIDLFTKDMPVSKIHPEKTAQAPTPTDKPPSAPVSK